MSYLSEWDIERIHGIHAMCSLADQGDPEAMYIWAMANLRGDGVGPDYPEARTYFELASQRGHTKAALQVAFMYLHGRGIPEDREKSARFFEMAAS
jgi:TPR repeat protein